MGSAEKSATIYIVRHGETIGNIQRIVFHPDDDVLSDIGKNQARLLSETLKDVQFTKVYTSQYPRTKETASIILDGNQFDFPRSDIKIEPRLKEIGLKSLHGKPYGYLLKGLVEFLQTGKHVEEFSIEDSEPIPELKQRAHEAIQDIFKDAFTTQEPETILIVSHGACMRMLMVGLKESDKFETSGWDPVGEKIIRNTGVMKLLVTENNGKIHINFQKFHDISHYTKEMLESDALKKLAETPEGKCLSGCFQV